MIFVLYGSQKFDVDIDQFDTLISPKLFGGVIDKQNDSEMNAENFQTAFEKIFMREGIKINMVRLQKV